jgi:hypothetical protein
MIQLANTHLRDLLNQKRGYLAACYVHLYTNDYIPIGGSAVGDFFEPIDQGYARQPVGFCPPAVLLAALELASITCAALSWTFILNVGAFTVYGWFLLDDADGGLVAAERFSTPVAITSAGQSLSVTPYFLEGTMP